MIFHIITSTRYSSVISCCHSLRAQPD